MFFLDLLYLLVFILVNLLFLCKLYYAYTKGQFQSDADLSGRIVLITGGNTGIGKEYVRDLAWRNATIIMACRNVQRGEECAKEIAQQTKNQKIIVEECDLSSLEKVKGCCERIRKRPEVPQIDFLVVFAAAVGDNQAENRLTEHGLEKQFQVNYLSHFLMIHLLIDLLNRSNQGRLILTSSASNLLGMVDLSNVARLGKYDRQPFLTYADSKLAIIMLTKELGRRLGSLSPILVNAFHPGTVYTNGIKHINTGWSTFFWKSILLLMAFLHGKTTKDGAQTMLFLTLSENVNSGDFFSDCRKARYNRSADDPKLCQDLWQLSLELVKPFLGEIDPLLA